MINWRQEPLKPATCELPLNSVCAEGGFSLAGPNKGHLQLPTLGKGHLQHNFTQQLTQHGSINEVGAAPGLQGDLLITSTDGAE